MKKRVHLDELPQDMTLRDLAKVAHAFGVEMDIEAKERPEVTPVYLGGRCEISFGRGDPILDGLRCNATTLKGERCLNPPVAGGDVCHVHVED